MCSPKYPCISSKNPPFVLPGVSGGVFCFFQVHYISKEGALSRRGPGQAFRQMQFSPQFPFPEVEKSGIIWYHDSVSVLRRIGGHFP